MNTLLEQIWKAANKKDFDKVRQLLNTHQFTYREAQLYCEMFKNDKQASKYILKQATCKCGMLVTGWQYNKTPTCTNCNFKSVMEKIQYSRNS